MDVQSPHSLYDLGLDMNMNMPMAGDVGAPVMMVSDSSFQHHTSSSSVIGLIQMSQTSSSTSTHMHTSAPSTPNFLDSPTFH